MRLLCIYVDMGYERLESCPRERNTGVLVAGKVNVYQKGALVAQRADCTLGCTRPSTTSQAGGGAVHSALCCVVSPPALREGWVPQYRKDIKL